MKQLSVSNSEHKLRPLFTSGETKVVQLSLPKGGVLDKHKTDHTLAVLVISGAIRFEIENELTELQMQDMIVVEPLKEHAAEAMEDSIVLLFLLPDLP